MVKHKHKFPILADGTIDLDTWLSEVKETRELDNIDMLSKAARLAETESKGLTTFYGQPCIEQGLEMAEIILDLKLDKTAVAAAILTSTVHHTHLSHDVISEKVDPEVTQLISHVEHMKTLQPLIDKRRDKIQIDRLRKMFLAMVSDIRVVLIKLAERTCIMRGIKNVNPIERKRLAEETINLYAPLANRLGIGQLKWELEDLAFHYYDPETYKSIASFLAERRTDREKRIHEIITQLQKHLAEANIQSEVTGRAKHIYSIYLKMRQKNLALKDIYDFSAVRILVPTLKDCYTALSIVHSLWKHLEEEFDDYINRPKPNGYRSIHTAVIGPDGKNLEIQIRTFNMHDEAEHGVAAHWLYKEKKTHLSGYEAKITFLRQLLDWHKEVTSQTKLFDQNFEKMLEDRIYVFTPTGDIIDLTMGATPLDFAYHVHTDVGHHCRGAKVNGHIVPLTYSLQTGDQVDIITHPKGTPSRDWLSHTAGYLKTTRARAKVAHWFHQLEIASEKEVVKPHPVKKITPTPIHIVSRKETTPHLAVAGISDLLTRMAKCCKPIPGDSIIGFITQGRGVSIHKKDCNNMLQMGPIYSDRLIPVAWDKEAKTSFYVDIKVIASGRAELLKEITGLLANAKLDLVNLNSTLAKKNNLLNIMITLQIHDINDLKSIMQQLSQLPNVIEVKRVSD